MQIDSIISCNVVCRKHIDADDCINKDFLYFNDVNSNILKRNLSLTYNLNKFVSQVSTKEYNYFL
jgi:hypothetical protein